jgi:hypothetical protein
MSHHRPIGLACLAVIAALFSLVLAFGGVTLFFQIGPMLDHGRYKPDYYPLGHIVLILVGVCLLVAAWIAATTAVDLWKLRNRGRSLALTGTPILAVFSLCWFFLETTISEPVSGYEFWTVFSILVLSISTVVYLRLPSVRLHFESQPLARTDS